MPDSFWFMPVLLDDPFPPLMELWSLNLAEDNVCQLASCSELGLYQKTGSVITSTGILNGKITAEVSSPNSNSGLKITKKEPVSLQ